MYTPSRTYRHLIAAALTLSFCAIADVSAQSRIQPAPVEPRVQVSLHLSTDYRRTDRNGNRSQIGTGSDGLLLMQAELPWARIPVDVFYSTRNNGSRTHRIRFGMHPELFGGRLKLDAGRFSVRSNDLTLGWNTVHGLGAALQAGILRGRVAAGRIETPPTTGIGHGQPVRPDKQVLELAAGIGSEEKGFIDLSMTHIADHSQGDTTTVGQQENSTLAARMQLPLFGDRIRLNATAAAAGYSSDVSAPLLEQRVIPDVLFTARTSSQIDGAATLGLAFEPSATTSLSLNGRWIGPGFVALAQPYMETDLMSFSIAPRLSLWDGRLHANGSIGGQWDNLRGTKSGTTSRLTGSLYATIQPVDWLNLDLSYDDIGASSDHTVDTIRFGYTSRSFELSSTFFWTGLQASHNATVTVAIQEGKTRTTADAVPARSTMLRVDGAWSITFPSTFSLTTSGGKTSTRNAFSEVQVWSVGETLSGTWLKDRLSASGTVGLSHYAGSVDGSSLDISITANCDLGDLGRLAVHFANAFDGGYGTSDRSVRDLYASARYTLDF